MRLFFYQYDSRDEVYPLFIFATKSVLKGQRCNKLFEEKYTVAKLHMKEKERENNDIKDDIIRDYNSIIRESALLTTVSGLFLGGLNFSDAICSYCPFTYYLTIYLTLFRILVLIEEMNKIKINIWADIYNLK
jgi:hypothetical protein